MGQKYKITSTILQKPMKSRDMQNQTEFLQPKITIEFLPYGSDMPYRVFISEDPIGFDGGDVNLYAYVGNNPVLLNDPSGLLVLYRGGGGAVGAGYKVNPTDQDPVTFMSGSVVHYGGTSRSGEHVSGMAFSGGAGRIE